MSKKKIVLSWIYICLSVALFIFAFANHYNPVEYTNQTSLLFTAAFVIIAAPCAVEYIKSIRVRMAEADGIWKAVILFVCIAVYLFLSALVAAIYTIKKLITTIIATVQYHEEREESEPEKYARSDAASDLIKEGEVDTKEVYRGRQLKSTVTSILNGNCKYPVELSVESKHSHHKLKLSIVGTAFYHNRVILINARMPSEKSGRIFFYEPKANGLYEINNPVTRQKIFGLIIRVGNGTDDLNTANIPCADYYFSYDYLPEFIKAGNALQTYSFKAVFTFPTSGDDYAPFVGKELSVKVYRHAEYRGLDCYVASFTMDMEGVHGENIFIAIPFSFCGEMRINIVSAGTMDFDEILRNVFPEYVTYSWGNTEDSAKQ